MDAIKKYFGFPDEVGTRSEVVPYIELKYNAVTTRSVPDVPEVELQSLVAFINEQISEAGAQQEKCFNDWMRSSSLLSERARIMAAGVAELIADAARRDAELRDTSAALRLAEASVAKYESELSELRPARAYLEEERRRLARELDDVTAAHRNLKETSGKLETALQEQTDKAIAAEIQLRRRLEDRSSLVSAAAEAERARQAKVIENNQLKSEQLAATANIQRLEQDLERIAAKLSAEISAHENTRNSVRSLTADLQRMKQQFDDVIERLALTERAKAEETNAQAAEISQQTLKIVGLKSNVAFLERQRDKYREDFQMALERIGVLELSNTDLLKRVSAREGENA